MSSGLWFYLPLNQYFGPERSSRVFLDPSELALASRFPVLLSSQSGFSISVTTENVNDDFCTLCTWEKVQNKFFSPILIYPDASFQLTRRCAEECYRISGYRSHTSKFKTKQSKYELSVAAGVFKSCSTENPANFPKFFYGVDSKTFWRNYS